MGRGPQPSPPTPAPAPTPVPTPTPAPPPPANALAAGVTLSSPAGLGALEASRALRAFKTSCPALLKRQDQSSLTATGDWQSLCAEASTIPDTGAVAFFRGRARREGRELDNPTCLKIHLRDGRATEIWEFVWDLHAVDRFWA